MGKGLEARENEPQARIIADVFPGHGVQGPGMASDLNKHPAGRAVFEEADEALGFPLSTIILSGTTEDLRPNKIAQTAIFTVSWAAVSVFEAIHKDSDHFPAAVAGHSIGTYGAITRAGVLSFADSVRLLAHHAESMDNSEIGQGEGAMVAISSRGKELDEERVREVCRELEIDIAGVNSPFQIVISGDRERVNSASKEIGIDGILAVPLNISGGFHSRRLGDDPSFMEKLNSAPFKDPSFPIYLASTGRAVNSGEEIRRALAREMHEEVRWRTTIRNMTESGIEAFREFGPRKVLTRLITQTNPFVRTKNISDIDSAKRARF